jgi:hypothetical protein
VGVAGEIKQTNGGLRAVAFDMYEPTQFAIHRTHSVLWRDVLECSATDGIKLFHGEKLADSERCEKRDPNKKFAIQRYADCGCLRIELS